MADTIFALSSGLPPAAIAIVRISGPRAGVALAQLAGTLPEPRFAAYRTLRDALNNVLDHALVLWFPGKRTATGEDLAELHLHGGRAVIAAVENALSAIKGLRRAEPGEFTRRAFANGRIDLAEAEGIADLLVSETELQRRQAIALASGALSRQVLEWRGKVLAASAMVEAVLDFDDEDDVGLLPPGLTIQLKELQHSLGAQLDSPRAEILHDGLRVVLAGPPNSGKSSLFNQLVGDEAAITTPVAGTTRDVLTRSVALEGVPFTFVDTAGIRDETGDRIEAIGIERARAELDRADVVLWFGQAGAGSGRRVWNVQSFCDLGGSLKIKSVHYQVSATTGEGIENLRNDLVAAGRSTMPAPGATALNRRQFELLSAAHSAVGEALVTDDLQLKAEALRLGRTAFDRLLGHATTEDMLDALFGRFCIGK